MSSESEDLRSILRIGSSYLRRKAPPRRLLIEERERIVPVSVQGIDWMEAEGDYIRRGADGCDGGSWTAQKSS